MPVHHQSSFAPFLLAKLLLGHAGKPFSFLFYFVDGSAGYTKSINFLCNGFPCFSFGLIRNIVGKLALQDAFICLHVFCNYCQICGSKIRFPFSFFGTVSGMLFWIHVCTDTEKFQPYSFYSALTTGIPRALHSISRQNLFVMWESPLLDNLFLE